MTAPTLTAAQMLNSRRTMLDARHAQIGRTIYRWSDWSEEWTPLSTDDAKFFRKSLADAAETRTVTRAARTMGWHEFVCWHVARATAKKPAGGYAVVVPKDGVLLKFNGVPVFAAMSASTAYSWFERTAELLPLSRAADAVRADAYAREEATVEADDAAPPSPNVRTNRRVGA